MKQSSSKYDPPRIYLAAPWINKVEALAAQQAFEDAGYRTTSRWITAHSDEDTNLTEQAVQDLEDILQADILVILNLDKSEGKATEMGFALGMGMPVILIGDTSRNIFYHLPQIVRVDNVEEAIGAVPEVI